MHVKSIFMYVAMAIVAMCDCATLKHEFRPLVETDVKLTANSDTGNWKAKLGELEVNIEHSQKEPESDKNHTWTLDISRTLYENMDVKENDVTGEKTKEENEHKKTDAHVINENEDWNSEEDDELMYDPQNYEYFKGVGWFKLDSRHLTWSQALKACEESGGRLAVPNTKSRVKIFLKLFQRHPEIPRNAVLRQQVYVGVSDLDHDRIFTTVDGQTFKPSFPIWFQGEPSNSPPGEDCVTFHIQGKTRDVPCFYGLPFFCEKIIPVVI